MRTGAPINRLTIQIFFFGCQELEKILRNRYMFELLITNFRTLLENGMQIKVDKNRRRVLQLGCCNQYTRIKTWRQEMRGAEQAIKAGKASSCCPAACWCCWGRRRRRHGRSAEARGSCTGGTWAAAAAAPPPNRPSRTSGTAGTRPPPSPASAAPHQQRPPPPHQTTRTSSPATPPRPPWWIYSASSWPWLYYCAVLCCGRMVQRTS